MILTDASEKDVQIQSIETYLKNRLIDYWNYKKMFSSERIGELTRNDFDYTGSQDHFTS